MKLNFMTLLYKTSMIEIGQAFLFKTDFINLSLMSEFKEV